MKKFQLPFSEMNFTPSIAVFDDPTKGVQSQMQPEQKTPHYDGVKIDQLRELSSLHGHDKLDQLGIATRELDKSVQTYRKSGFHSQYTKLLTTQKSLKK